MKKPRRWMRHTSDGEEYGCYFPGTDLNVGQLGGRGTGAPPQGVKWLDDVSDVPYIKAPEYSRTEIVPNKSCPCLHTTPCNPRCTCIDHGSSRGCQRCCTYGSSEQQKAAAERIAKAVGRKRFAIKEETKPESGLASLKSPYCNGCGDQLGESGGYTADDFPNVGFCSKRCITQARNERHSKGEQPSMEEMFTSGPPYRTNVKPAPEGFPPSCCQDCGADLHAPLCGICERKRMNAELLRLKKLAGEL